MTTVISWNVNGLRAALKNGFMDWFQAAAPDILCLQETRVMPGELDAAALQPQGYVSVWNPARKPGYSGTAVYARQAPLSVQTLGSSLFDDEGRVQIVEFPEFTILNGYWPNSQAERARLAYKVQFVTDLTQAANRLVKNGKNVLLCGDFNIAHQPIDLARPKDNEDNPGYYPEEREAMTGFLDGGYVDSFRHFCPEPGHYTWWSYRTRARERGIGWRLDYHCVNRQLIKRVKRAWILNEVLGSDHCPVGIEIE